MKVAVFGLGYVGTVTAACLAANGHDVWGIDTDELKVHAIAAGTSPIVEPGLQSLVAQSVESGKLHATIHPDDALAQADVSLLCVGTPSATSGETNLAYIYRVVEDLVQAITDSGRTEEFHTVVIRSTVPPGTVEDVNAILKAAFRDSGPYVGVAMCPEFLREGSGISRLLRTALHRYRRVGSSSDRRGVTPLLIPWIPSSGRSPPDSGIPEVRVQCFPCHQNLLCQRYGANLQSSRRR